MKIGTYQIPDIPALKALKFSKVVYDFPLHKVSYLGFCQKLGLKPDAGYPGQIVLAMKLLGLTTEDKDEIKTTSLAEQFFLPKGHEFEEAKQTLFERIPLWTALQTHFKGQIQEIDFWVYLAEMDNIKDVDRQIVAKKAPLVLKSYNDALELLNADKIDFNLGKATLGRGERKTKRMAAVVENPADDESSLEKTVTVSTGAVGRIQVPDIGYVDVRDLTTYQMAKLYLRSMRDKLGITENDKGEIVP